MNMSASNTVPALSIIIPARNRFLELETLMGIIDTCDPLNVEFLISDNSDAPLGLKSSNPACKTIRPEKVLNMTENWNFSLSHARGKYLCWLGDDDAIIPSNLSELVRSLQGREEDIVWHPRATYEWPSAEHNGHFFQEIKPRRKRESLERQRQRVLNFKYQDLPIPYHDAIVHRRVVEKYRIEHPGSPFFGSRTPDYHAGAKILFLAESQREFRKTVFISGASATSNGKLTHDSPDHERANEFLNFATNPPPSWFPEMPIPVGFLWLYEAVEEALRNLRVSHLVNNQRLCRISIAHSQDSEAMFVLAAKIWPGLWLSRNLGRAWGGFRRLFTRTGLLSAFRKARILVRIMFKGHRIISLRGTLPIGNTRALVDFLEEFKIGDSKAPIVRKG
jgi:hypothetical protein